MFFATYIQRLHDCIEPETNRGDFTKKILELIVTNPNKVKYSNSSYNGFFDGKTEGKGNDKKIIRDMICNCAKKSVDYLDVSEDKVNTLPRFKNYLKELRFNTSAKKQLCDSFRCELPNINVDNYIDELSELLIKIIKVAAGKESKEENTIPSIEANSSDSKEDLVSNNTDFLSDNHVEDNSININNTSIINNYVCMKGNSSVEGKNIEHIENELQTAEDPIKVLMISLKEIVNNLIEIGNKIASRKIKPIVPKLAVSPEIYEALTQSNVPSKITLELDNEFERLQDLYDVIYRYNAEHKNETLDSILELILNTNEKAFIETWNSLTIMTLKNQSVFNLMKLIQDYFQVKDE